MIIDWVQIKNFRCIKDLRVDLSNLTAFVGRNGSGKSTTLHALNTFYIVKANITEDDFFNSDTALPIEITVAYRDLGPQELEEFASFLNDGSFVVLKKILMINGAIDQRYYATKLQIPAIAELRKAKGVTEKRNGWNELVKQGILPDIGPKSVKGDDPNQLMDKYEQLHPELREWIHEEVQLLGPPNIGGGKLDNYTKFVYVPAVRDAADDSAEKRGSPLYQLLDFIVMRRFRARSDVRHLQGEFSNKLKELYDPSKLTEFSELAVDISKTLQLYVPSAQFELRVTEPKLPEIPSPATIAQLIEDEYAGSIDRKGHGLQRALIFSLLQHMAVARPIEVDPEDVEAIVPVEEKQLSKLTSDIENAPTGMDSITSGPDLIIAIEEPELYQHPLRARHLSRILLEMSREKKLGPGGRNQIVYTTHSPYFVDLERFDQLRIVRKNKETSDEPPCTGVSSYSLKAAASKMAELTGRSPDQFTAASFRARAYPVMTQTVNEGFFADVVVLVEGDTEAAALLTVANRIGSDWLSKGVAVIPVEGKTKIDRAAVVFRGLGIPTYIIFDSDGRHNGTEKGSKEAQTNRLLLKLCGALEEDFPSSRADTEYACFEDDFEAYCRKEIGSAIYESLREQAAKESGFQGSLGGAKNFDVVVALVNTIYAQGHQLTLIEQIIKHVDQKLQKFTAQQGEVQNAIMELETSI